MNDKYTKEKLFDNDKIKGIVKLVKQLLLHFIYHCGVVGGRMCLFVRVIGQIYVVVVVVVHASNY